VSKAKIVLIVFTVLMVGWFLGEDPSRSPSDGDQSFSEGAEFRLKSTLTKIGADTAKVMQYLYKNTETAKPYNQSQKRPPAPRSDFATGKGKPRRPRYNPAPLPNNAPGEIIRMDSIAP